MAVVQWNSEDTGNIETFTTSTDDDVGDDDGDDDDDFYTPPDEDDSEGFPLSYLLIICIVAILIINSVKFGMDNMDNKKGGSGNRRRR